MSRINLRTQPQPPSQIRGNLRYLLDHLRILAHKSRNFQQRIRILAQQVEEFKRSQVFLENALTAPEREARSHEIAAKQGIDVAKLKEDMKDPAVAKELADNHALAQALNINGTPGFVIAACNFYVSLTAGDYVEMWAAVDDVAVTFDATAAQTSPFAMPAIPSVVATLSFVSRLPA